jgi:NADPH:quinone reductase-like Zn-dependent oxidoreductase
MKVAGVTLPNVGGLALTGRVVGVDRVLVGQSVAAMLKIGGYAELAVATASAPIRQPVPIGLPTELHHQFDQ